MRKRVVAAALAVREDPACVIVPVVGAFLVWLALVGEPLVRPYLGWGR